MLYVITEDTNSGRTFWRAVFDTFLSTGKYVLYNDDKKLNGNTSLQAALKDVVTNYTKLGDSVFVAFDNIGASSNFNSYNFIKSASHACREARVSLYLSNYYCFEEVYASYTEMEHICRTMSKAGDIDAVKLADILKYIRECIDRGEEYYKVSNEYVAYLINMVPDAGYNKEHFLDVLLRQASRKVCSGFFSISKEKEGFGKCLLRSCDDVRSHYSNKRLKGYLSKSCKVCTFSQKDKTIYDKLVHLNNNSVLKLGIRFTELNELIT